MKRNIIIVIIFLILLSVSVYEEALIGYTKDNLGSNLTVLTTRIDENKDNINQDEIMDSFNNLDNFWDKQKVKLCFFTNYDKIRFVDESLLKIHDGIRANNIEIVEENISTLKSFNEFISYIMGFNINNLF